jgi:MFS family permease
MCITTNVNIQGPLYAVYAHNDGYTSNYDSVFLYVLGVIPVLLAFGGLSDRIGRRKTILIALALSITATAHVIRTRASVSSSTIHTGWNCLMVATATAYMIEPLAHQIRCVTACNNDDRFWSWSRIDDSFLIIL